MPAVGEFGVSGFLGFRVYGLLPLGASGFRFFFFFCVDRGFHVPRPPGGSRK